MVAGRFKEVVKKYGKVGLGVHFTISAASITSLYIAIKNNIDVESMLEKVGMPSLIKEKDNKSSNLPSENPTTSNGFESESRIEQTVEKERNRTAELVASSGGALALALLINKALFPLRVPITLAVTPPVRRFLVRHNLIKNKT
ncbi:putative membrane protein [Handroanthus impetiginosus]|uniref:Putative membrane protein n=1 Tax=Handroanthus impetiginosus TaxID=429701 RepID=A0A2G9GD01_9LAMI|nr:putative membrane protein [Handroanthus impetiginosus]